MITALTRRPVVVVAAHPDDETIGAGGLLARMRHVTVVTVTDGAPRQPGDAERAGCASREEYARLRHDELLAALSLAGIGPDRVRPLRLTDQEASLEMAYLTMRLVDVLRELTPAIILTHPYEGGHPDHDATAFAVHAACARVESPPEVIEFTSYHAQPDTAGAIEVGEFLANTTKVTTLRLSETARRRKSEMVQRFASQLHMLQHWPLDVERYRPAPAYDFTRPPHQGKLHYENYDWGMTGPRWLQLAEEALRTLGAGAAGAAL